MPPEYPTRMIAAATASSRPYSTEERSQYPWITWLLKNWKLGERDNLVKGTKKSLTKHMKAMVPQATAPLKQAAGLSHSSCKEGPEHTMRDAWEGSEEPRESSHAGSEGVVDTLRSGLFDSDYQGVSHSGGSDYASIERTVRGQRTIRGHGGLPQECPEEDILKGSELPEENEEEKAEDRGYPRSSRLANPLASLRLEAKWSPIRFENRLPAVKKEDQVAFKMSFVSPAEEAPEDDSDEEGDRSLPTFQPNAASLWSGVTETGEPLRIPSPPWRNSPLFEEPRAITPEPVDPPRKKRRIC